MVRIGLGLVTNNYIIREKINKNNVMPNVEYIAKTSQAAMPNLFLAQTRWFCHAELVSASGIPTQNMI
jgi:hypothetical protein